MLTIDGFLNVKAIILASTKHCGTIGYANRKTISTSNDCESHVRHSCPFSRKVVQINDYYCINIICLFFSA